VENSYPQELKPDEDDASNQKRSPECTRCSKRMSLKPKQAEMIYPTDPSIWPATIRPITVAAPKRGSRKMEMAM
jgi:hypothetical protein